MNNIVYCDLWNENDGIYVQFDESTNIETMRNIIDGLSLQGNYDECSTYEVFCSCNEPSWSDLADVREEVSKVITNLGYEIVWL